MKARKRLKAKRVAKEKSSSRKVQQTIQSARSVARAWRETSAEVGDSTTSARFIRIDGAHRVDERGDGRTPTAWNAPDPTAQLVSIRNAISFGLLVFLMGQALMMGAFIAGHYSAWSIGILFSIGGITVSLLSVNEALRRLENRIADNSQNDSRPRQKSKSPGNR